jgi:hypothetical protein
MPSRITGALGNLGSKIAGVFSKAWGSVKSAISGLIDKAVGLFKGIGSRIAGAMGDVGGKIMSTIKSKIPKALRKFVPGLANGGIVAGPMLAQIGEAGPEAVIPLTRPARALQLAQKSGLDRLILGNHYRNQARSGHPIVTGTTAAAAGGSGPLIENLYVTSNARSEEAVARRTATLIAARAGI